MRAVWLRVWGIFFHIYVYFGVLLGQRKISYIFPVLEFRGTGIGVFRDLGF